MICFSSPFNVVENNVMTMKNVLQNESTRSLDLSQNLNFLGRGNILASGDLDMLIEFVDMFLNRS